MISPPGVYTKRVGSTMEASCSHCGARSVTHIDAPEMLRQFLSNHQHKEIA